MGYVLVSHFKGYSIFPVKLTSFPASKKIDSTNEIDPGPIEPTPLRARWIINFYVQFFYTLFLIFSQFQE